MIKSNKNETFQRVKLREMEIDMEER